MTETSEKLTEFVLGSKSVKVKYVETQTVKEGVECDIYIFVEDGSKDLAIVRVKKGYKTPFQRVILGDKTIEGYMWGAGILTVDSEVYKFELGRTGQEVIVRIGQTMQWSADDSDLTFYEICEPPYSDGRFKNLTQ